MTNTRQRGGYDYYYEEYLPDSRLPPSVRSGATRYGSRGRRQSSSHGSTSSSMPRTSSTRGDSSYNSYHHESDYFYLEDQARARRRNYEKEFADWEYSQIDRETNRIVNKLMPVVEHSLSKVSTRQGAPDFLGVRSEIATGIAHEMKKTLQKEVSRRESRGTMRGDIRSVNFRAEGIELNGDGTELTLKDVSTYGSGWFTGKQPTFNMVFTVVPG
ncbi:hypothetical protein IAR50_000131 [Cryptococcus sp. DSM 104548]